MQGLWKLERCIDWWHQYSRDHNLMSSWVLFYIPHFQGWVLERPKTWKLQQEVYESLFSLAKGPGDGKLNKDLIGSLKQLHNWVAHGQLQSNESLAVLGPCPQPRQAGGLIALQQWPRWSPVSPSPPLTFCFPKKGHLLIVGGHRKYFLPSQTALAGFEQEPQQCQKNRAVQNIARAQKINFHCNSTPQKYARTLYYTLNLNKVSVYKNRDLKKIKSLLK